MNEYAPYISNVYSMYRPGSTRTIGVSYGSPNWFQPDPSLPDYPLLPEMIATNNGVLFPGNQVGVRQGTNSIMNSSAVTIGQNTLNSAGAVGYYYYLPLQVTMYAEPAAPPVPIPPEGYITFSPSDSGWINHPLDVTVTVDGDISNTLPGSALREYRHRVLDCSDPLHVLPSDHTAACYDQLTDEVYSDYTQEYQADPVLVGSSSLLETEKQTAIRSGTVRLAQDGVGLLTGRLSGWTGQTGVWEAGNPPSGSWRNAVPPSLAEPTETYRSTSGIYHIDLSKPQIHISGGGPQIFEPDNEVSVQFSDNLSGVSEVRMLWSQSAARPNREQMAVVSASTSEFTGSDSSTLSSAIDPTSGLPVGTGVASFSVGTHEGMRRYGQWHLHLYARDRAGNETYVSERVDVRVELRNFRVSDVTDPAWESLFWDPDAATGEHRAAWYYPPQMPILTNPLTRRAARMGSAFHFDLESLGMNEDADEIRVIPRFFYLASLSEADIRNAYEVDMYYNQGAEAYIPYGDPLRDKWTFSVNMKNGSAVKSGIAGATRASIGSHAELLLDENVRGIDSTIEARWYGKYGLMLDSVALRKNTPILLNGRINTAALLKKGYILVNLSIDAYKGDARLFSYMPDAWNDEGGPSDSNLWYSGDIMIFDLGNRVSDAYVPGGDR